jgi:hypothetical protein
MPIFRWNVKSIARVIGENRHVSFCLGSCGTQMERARAEQSARALPVERLERQLPEPHRLYMICLLSIAF